MATEREPWRDAVDAAIAGCARVSADAVLAHVRAAIAGGAASAHAGDLALAFAVAAGDPAAARRFEALVGGELVAAARAIDRDPAFVDEICQLARVRLVVGERFGAGDGAGFYARRDGLDATLSMPESVVEALARLNRVDPLEVFTLFHGQAVRAGQVVASAKVAPHLVAGHAVAAGIAVARASAPLVDVAPYLPLPVAAIAAEPLATGALERFEGAARAKVEGLGGTFVGCYPAARRPGDTDEAMGLGAVLDDLGARGVRILLVGGVSAGDPLAPMFEALATRGGAVVRRGVPAHPGSMIWFGRLGGATLMGLPQCGMFSMATAADLVLPRLLTGEMITADALADLGHGGLLGREMRFRLPDYARELETPADP